MKTRLEAPTAAPLSSQQRAAAVEATGLVRRFAGGVEALAGLALRVEPGAVTAVVGPSGCGKSTLLEVVAGLQEPDAGTVSVLGATRSRDRLARCAYMPQRDALLPWRDALANAALALESQGVGRREARRRARPLFERFGLAGFERTRPAALSGGMRQRVAFLRTLLTGRPVLLLDEPFAALDAIARADIQAWLAAAIESERRTAVLVTHDVEEALYLADRVVVLSRRPGRAVAELEVALPRPRPPREQVVTDPAFTALRRRALEALPA